MMLKIGLRVAQDYTVFNYGPPSQQKDLNPQDRKILAGTGMKPAQNVLGIAKRKLGRNPPPYVLIMDNLETSLDTTWDKARGNTSGDIVERLIKPRVSKIFGHPVYSLDGPGPSMEVSGTHEDFQQ